MSEKTYIEAIGRRKTATARVRMMPAKAFSVIVNDLPLAEYFVASINQSTIENVCDTDETAKAHSFTVRVKGGGLRAQAEAIRLGMARALVAESQTRRGALKKAGYLKRDPRAKERKKFGLLKARKRPQWSKR